LLKDNVLHILYALKSVERSYFYKTNGHFRRKFRFYVLKTFFRKFANFEKYRNSRVSLVVNMVRLICNIQCARKMIHLTNRQLFLRYFYLYGYFRNTARIVFVRRFGVTSSDQWIYTNDICLDYKIQNVMEIKLHAWSK